MNRLREIRVCLAILVLLVFHGEMARTVNEILIRIRYPGNLHTLLLGEIFAEGGWALTMHFTV